MKGLTDKQVEELEQDIKQEKIDEEQRARQDNLFNEWFKESIISLIEDFVELRDNEFMEYCHQCYEAEEE